jgi:hypothetical protein
MGQARFFLRPVNHCFAAESESSNLARHNAMTYRSFSSPSIVTGRRAFEVSRNLSIESCETAAQPVPSWESVSNLDLDRKDLSYACRYGMIGSRGRDLKHVFVLRTGLQKRLVGDRWAGMRSASLGGGFCLPGGEADPRVEVTSPSE